MAASKALNVAVAFGVAIYSFRYAGIEYPFVCMFGCPLPDHPEHAAIVLYAFKNVGGNRYVQSNDELLRVVREAELSCRIP